MHVSGQLEFSQLSLLVSAKVLDVASVQLAYKLPCTYPLQPLFWRSMAQSRRYPDVVVRAPLQFLLLLLMLPCLCCLNLLHAYVAWFLPLFWLRHLSHVFSGCIGCILLMGF
jgi:hypothetical protein